ncbi:unnamed protein product [Victoria cruziana]
MEMNKVVNAVLNPPGAEKMKASNFPATFLKIGSWERVSRYNGDIVSKCYFAKRKLVWEILEGGLKSKIEIQWSDITALKATYRKNKPDQLEVELSKLPHFFHETNPQPRKHTLWQAANDFTGGQAVTCRRHLIQFAEGTLEKHYQKLLRCDSRLHALSKANFPDYASPYFQTDKQEYQDHSGLLSHLQPQKDSVIPYTFCNISNELFHPPIQLYAQAHRISSRFDQGDFQHFRPAFDFDTPSSSAGYSSACEELGISNSDDGYIGGSLQYCEPVYGNIHDSLHDSYLSMSTDITLGNQDSHSYQGHTATCCPSFPANGAGYVSADQEAPEGITTGSLYEPIISGCFDNQNRETIARMNAPTSLIGATDASMSAPQQGDFNPLYQIVTENAEGNPFSDRHIVPSSWGTTSGHLVESIHGKGLRNYVYGVPSY